MTTDNPDMMHDLATVVVTAFVPQKKSGSQGSGKAKTRKTKK